MANAWRIEAGDVVHYKRADGRWCFAKCIVVTDQSHTTLAIVNSDGSRTALNAGGAVAKRTASGQTNVWRP